MRSGRSWRVARLTLLLAVWPLWAGGCTQLVRSGGTVRFATPSHEEGDVAPQRKGEVHVAHEGQIVFSRAPILYASEDPAAFSSTFTLPDPIYGRAYLPTNLCDAARAQGWPVDVEGRSCLYVVRMQVGDRLVAEIPVRPEAKRGHRWLTFPVVLNKAPGDPDKAGLEGQQRVSLVDALRFGDEVHVSLVPATPRDDEPARGASWESGNLARVRVAKTPVATGTFRLIADAPERAAWLAQHG